MEDAAPNRSVVHTIGRWLAYAAAFALLSTGAGRLRAPEPPETTPDFTLVATDGTSFTLSELKGRQVVLNFWATWCGPCRVEMPLLSIWAEAHPEVVVLGVTVDDDERKIASLADGNAFPLLLGGGPVSHEFGVQILPTTVVIDEEGHVGASHGGILFGPQLDLLLW